MVLIYAVLALCFSHITLAQITGFGSCPDVSTMSDFNISEIEGQWYEARRYFTTFEVGVKCVTSDIKDSGDGIMLLDASAIYSLSGHLGEIKNITVRVANPSEPGKLIVKFPGSNDWNNLWILGANYNSSLIGYNCIDYTLINKKYLWIFTRDQDPSIDVIDDAIKIITDQKLDKYSLSKSDQSNCNVQP